jgi:hypothetical protein
LNNIQRFSTDIIGLEKYLSGSSPIAQVNKTNGPFASVCLHESCNGHGLVDKVGAQCLDFSKCMRSVSGWNPSGHGWWAAVENMKHSPLVYDGIEWIFH